MRQHPVRSTILLLAAVCLGGGAAAIQPQKTAAEDAAGRISGSWTINRDLSPSFRPSGRRGGIAFQRGRGGGSPASDPTPSGPGDLTPTERAEQVAMMQIGEIAATITIKATADSASFVDPRGEQSCAINDKSAKADLFGARVTVKCRWNKQTLQQEFSTTRSKLTRSWSVDGSGHLVVKIRSEGQGQRALEASAVYDKTS